MVCLSVLAARADDSFFFPFEKNALPCLLEAMAKPCICCDVGAEVIGHRSFYILSLFFLFNGTSIVRLELEILVIKVLGPSLWGLCFYSCNRDSSMYIL